MIALDNGFQEAVAIVLDVEETAARLCRLFGYAVIARAATDQAMLDLLEVDPSWSAEEALVGDAAQGRGYIRLVAFPGRESGLRRDGAQPWDVGGLFDVDIRALRAIEPIHGAMTRNGFSAFGPLTRWDFGSLVVKEAVYRDSDGLAIALIERMSPPLAGFEQVTGPASYVFNSVQVVAHFDSAARLFREAFGWMPCQESRWTPPEGRNCMGLPLDVARSRELRIGIYHQRGSTEGSVELIDYGGEALDFSSVSPPDRGWASLRFPMSDPADFLVRAEAGGCLIRPLRSAHIEPYGEVQAGSAITPWGARLEVFQPF